MKLKELYEKSSISTVLYKLADDFDIDPCTVFSFAKILGRDADYEQLINTIKDHCECTCDEEFEMEEWK